MTTDNDQLGRFLHVINEEMQRRRSLMDALERGDAAKYSSTGE